MTKLVSRSFAAAVLVLAAAVANGQGAKAAATPASAYTPPACVPGVPFADITCTTGFDPWIEQFGLDGITSGCGGGNYCPGTPVTRNQMAVFIEHAMRGTANWPPHTVLVYHHPAAEANSNVNSGSELLSMVAAIPSTGSEAPSGINPWLVKIGPGIFDLNGQSVSLPPYVNLDGAGQNSTTITTSFDSGDVISTGSGANTVSNITVENNSNGTVTYGIYAVGTDLTLDHVFVQATGGSGLTNAIYSSDSNLVIFDGTIFALAGSSVGIYTWGSQYHSSQVWRTMFSCGTADVYNFAGQEVDLAYAIVSDSLFNFSTGVFRCIGNYDYNLAPVTCP